MVWRKYYDQIKDNPYLPVAFFIGGFLADILLLDRVDGLLQFAQVLSYTLILSILVRLAVLENRKFWSPQGFTLKVWKYNELAIHFLLGSLLNLYSIFYFKSASIMTSIVFLVAIAALLLINEFLRTEKFQLIIILILYYICLTSFWILLIPTLMGQVGFFPFLLSLIATGLSLWLFDVTLPRDDRNVIKPLEFKTSVRQFNFRIGSGVILFFLVSYYFQLIPPVPLSVNYAGIFHKVEKINNRFILTHQNPEWKFWNNGDQIFQARPNDKIIAYSEIFAPNRFKDQIFVRWLLKTEQGWQQQDRIPLTIIGGRDNGFRGYTIKSNYQAGKYRVQIETTDERVIGRIELEVVKNDSLDPYEQYLIERN